MVNSQSTADLTISKVYSTSYYGDTFNFTCMVNVDPEHGYLGVEFVMTQSFLTGYYYYGDVCYDDSSYSWENLSPPSCMGEVLGEGRRKVTIFITLRADMYDPSSYIDQVTYKCKLIYQSSGLFGVSTNRVHSPSKQIPISDINIQSIALEISPNYFIIGDDISATCISTNSYATLSLRTYPEATESLNNLPTENNQIFGQFTYDSSTESIECSDGGRRIEGKTYVRKNLLSLLSTSTSGPPRPTISLLTSTLSPIRNITAFTRHTMISTSNATISSVSTAKLTTVRSSINSNITIEVLPVDQSDNQTVIRYGKEALFRCQVNLLYPLSQRREFYGITLQVTKDNGEEFQDGCLGVDHPEIPEFEKLFSQTFKSCPSVRNSGKQLLVSIKFTVTADLIGLNRYSCLFKWQRFALFSSDSRLNIEESEEITVLGIQAPIITLQPTLISRFEGETVRISCSSSGGYPVGTVGLFLDSQRIRDARTIQTKAVQMLSATVVLTKQYNNKTLQCYNINHTGQVRRLIPIHVKYMRKLELNQTFFGIKGNVKLDCSKYIASNTRLNYEWSRSVVADSQISFKEVDILYSSREPTDVNVVTCNVSMVNDPLEATISVKLLFYFETSSEAGKKKQVNIGVVIVIVLVLLVTVAILGRAAGREITSRKINARVRIIKLEHQNFIASERRTNKLSAASDRNKQPKSFTNIPIT